MLIWHIDSITCLFPKSRAQLVYGLSFPIFGDVATVYMVASSGDMNVVLSQYGHFSSHLEGISTSKSVSL